MKHKRNLIIVLLVLLILVLFFNFRFSIYIGLLKTDSPFFRKNVLSLMVHEGEKSIPYFIRMLDYSWRSGPNCGKEGIIRLQNKSLPYLRKALANNNPTVRMFTSEILIENYHDYSAVEILIGCIDTGSEFRKLHTLEFFKNKFGENFPYLDVLENQNDSLVMRKKIEEWWNINKVNYVY